MVFVYCVCMYCVIDYKYDVTFINKYYILFNMLIIIMIVKELSLILPVSAGGAYSGCRG